MNSKLKAFVMAAGFGTRLEPLTLAVPKPMVYVANKPIMQHNIELLKKNNITDICANIHYFPEQIENFFGNGSSFGVNLLYSYEEKLLGTAGGVKKMAEVSGGVNDTFVVLSSDALTDINISKLIEFHKKKKAIATIALYSVLDTSQFGVVIQDSDGRVTAFQEKPLIGKALSNMANTGIYIFEPEILDMIPKNRFYDFGKELFPKLVKAKKEIYGYPMGEYWSDVGSLEQYHAANADVLNARVNIDTPKKHDKVLIGEGVKIGENVRIIGPTVIGDKTVIKSNAKIERSIIWSDVVIGSHSHVSDSIVGNWCHIDDKVKIEPGCVIGNRCRISSGTVIPGKTKMRPNGHM